MSQTTSPSLNLPYIQAAQAQKHVTHNEALRVLDAVVQLTVLRADQSTPPVGAADGDRYIVAAGATGDWAGQDGQIALAEQGSWTFFAPQTGFRAWVQNSATWAVYTGTAWIDPLEGAGGGDTDVLQDVELFGLNATASAGTPFVVRAENALWQGIDPGQGGTGSVIQSLSRVGTTTDAGFSFQTDFTTQGLFGFFGSDALRLSVSQDGTTFRDAFSIDPATGQVAQPQRARFKGTTNYENLFSPNTWTTIAINTLEANPQGAFDAASYRFTALVAGTYLFGGATVYKYYDTNSVRFQMRFLKNGTEEVIGSFRENSGSHFSMRTSLGTQTMVALEANDTIELQLLSRGGHALIVPEGTGFWGVQLS